MRYAYLDETFNVRLERHADGTLTAWVGDTSYSLRAAPTADGGLLLDFGDRRTVVHTAGAGAARYAHVDGHAYALTTVDERGRRRKARAAGGDLTAAMPGQVVDVLVAPGEAVTAGQALVILEAMKMEIRVSAPADGTVARVLVQPGNVVERGQSLIVLDGAPGA